MPAAGAPGGPETALDGAALDRFARGRALFDRDAAISGGLGPKFNGDSCRACHFDPVIGGAGPLDVNAMRTGKIGADGTFEAYPGGTGLAKLTTFGHVRPESEGNVFEPRQTPTALGLGVLDRIPEAAILEMPIPGTPTAMASRGSRRCSTTAASAASAGRRRCPRPVSSSATA